jgi:hypothetical protein
MAVKMVNNKVVNINPPSRLTEKQLRAIIKSPVNEERIQQALKSVSSVGVSRRKIVGL